MIRKLIFDVGEVILGYRWREMFEEYGLSMEDAERLVDLIFGEPLWEDMDRGIKNRTEVIALLCEKYPEDAAPIEWFISHCEKMPVPRERVWELVHQLKEAGYGIYLLSNYSKELFDMHMENNPVLDDIDGKVISYELKKIKPEPEIYQTLLKKYQLKPEECLFFDDRPRNVEGAKKQGIQGIVIESEEHLIQVLEEWLKKPIC